MVRTNGEACLNEMFGKSAGSVTIGERMTRQAILLPIM